MEKWCNNCEHWEKEDIEMPCRECLEADGIPCWEPIKKWPTPKS